MSLWKGGSSSVTLKGTQRCGRVGGFPEARAEPGRAAGPTGPGLGSGAGGRGPERKSLQEGREQREPHTHFRRHLLLHHGARAQG